MTTLLSFVVPGIPVPLERPRFSRGRTYLPEKSRDYRQDIQDNALEAIPPGWDPHSRYAVWIEARYKVLPKHDVDNLAKAVLDALNNLVWADDEQVDALFTGKTVGCPENGLVVYIYDLRATAPGCLSEACSTDRATTLPTPSQECPGEASRPLSEEE